MVCVYLFFFTLDLCCTVYLAHNRHGGTLPEVHEAVVAEYEEIVLQMIRCVCICISGAPVLGAGFAADLVAQGDCKLNALVCRGWGRGVGLVMASHL